MRRNALIALVAAAVVAAVVAAVGLRGRRPSPPQSVAPRPTTGQPASPATAAPAGQPPQPATPKPAAPVPMEFTREGVAGKIVQEVEHVARPGHVQVAVEPREGGRWVCILVDEAERYYDLDVGLKPEDFPALQAGGFRPAPPPVIRTISIYRSVAKRAMGFDSARGDRILVLLCPRDEWPKLGLSWPAQDGRP